MRIVAGGRQPLGENDRHGAGKTGRARSTRCDPGGAGGAVARQATRCRAFRDRADRTRRQPDHRRCGGESRCGNAFSDGRGGPRARRAMALDMARAGREVVPATLHDEADVDAWPAADVTARLIRAVVAGCAAEPRLNASFHAAALSLAGNASD